MGKPVPMKSVHVYGFTGYGIWSRHIKTPRLARRFAGYMHGNSRHCSCQCKRMSAHEFPQQDVAIHPIHDLSGNSGSGIRAT